MIKIVDEKCCQNDLWEEPVTTWWETNVYQVAMRTFSEWHISDFAFLWNLVGIVKTNLVGIVAGDCKTKTWEPISTDLCKHRFMLVSINRWASCGTYCVLQSLGTLLIYYLCSTTPHNTNFTGIWKYVWIKTCNMSQAHAWGHVFQIFFFLGVL